MPFFTPVRTLPEGTVYYTDLTPVQDFADWLAEFDTLLDQHQNSLFATVCAPMRLQKSNEQRIADRKTYLAWIKARQPQLGFSCRMGHDRQPATSFGWHLRSGLPFGR